MDAAQLQAAVAQYLAGGGQVTRAAGRAQRPASKADNPAIVDALRQYRYITHAAKALHLSTRTVGRLARTHGVQFASNNSALSRSARQQQEARLAVQIRRLAGRMSRKKLACTLSIGEGVLRRVARENNINISSRNITCQKQT
jgi:DNA invertase Pin-like site-specific DNA recombinase